MINGKKSELESDSSYMYSDSVYCNVSKQFPRQREAEPILVLTRREGAGFVLTRDHSN
jgi:hypothetical protein